MLDTILGIRDTQIRLPTSWSLHSSNKRKAANDKHNIRRTLYILQGNTCYGKKNQNRIKVISRVVVGRQVAMLNRIVRIELLRWSGDIWSKI